MSDPTTVGKGTMVMLTMVPNNFLAWTRGMIQMAAEADLTQNATILNGGGEFSIPPKTTAEVQEILGMEASAVNFSKFAMDMRMNDIKEEHRVTRKNGTFIALMLKWTSVDSYTRLKGLPAWEEAVRRHGI